MHTKRFTKNDSGFTCLHCDFEAEPLGHTSRNHCPRCLYSLHVDVNPGDRANPCGGLMEPIGVEGGPGAYVVVHRCLRCGEVRRNRAVTETPLHPDDMDTIIRLSASAHPGGER